MGGLGIICLCHRLVSKKTREQETELLRISVVGVNQNVVGAVRGIVAGQFKNYYGVSEQEDCSLLASEFRAT